MVDIEWGSVDWGTAGEWFGGIGGFLAVGVAGWFGWLEHKRADEERAARKQAEHNAAERALLLRAHQFRISAPGGWSTVGATATFKALISSSAEVSFYNVMVFAEFRDGNRVPSEIGELGPGSTRDVTFSITTLEGVHSGPTWTAEYSDVEGYRWRTDPFGNVESG